MKLQYDMGLSSGRERDRSGWGERAYAGSRLLGGHELAVLLNARAATDLRDTSGKTALGYARQSGETESVALLERVDAAE